MHIMLNKRFENVKSLLKKSVVIIVLFVAAFFLFACSSSHKNSYPDSYHIGYSDGYAEGYDDGSRIEYDVGSSDWESYIEDIGIFFEEHAIDYVVRDMGGWHPEEAMVIIDSYRNNTPFYEDGAPPSEQDYLDAIDSLIFFYDYFYSAQYK